MLRFDSTDFDERIEKPSGVLSELPENALVWAGLLREG